MSLAAIRQFVGNVGQAIYDGARYLQAFLIRRRTWVVQRWEGERGLSGAVRIAVFVHFDPKAIVHDYVRFYLEELRDAGYAVLFVTNGRKLSGDTLKYLRSTCALVLRRSNQGYDFGAYKDALQEIPDLTRLDSLIIANDSVYGPFHPLAEMLRRADPEQADIWGMTDTYDRYYHLQTYFLVVHRRALETPALHRFWKRVLYIQSKTSVIKHYEVGFSRCALAAGLRLRALYPYSELAVETIDEIHEFLITDPKDRTGRFQGDYYGEYLKWLYGSLNSGVPVNPSHFFWEQLLLRHHCPFLKRELLTRNPCKVPLILYWEAVIRQVSGYDTNLIRQHLQHALRNRSV